jgi:hypothetical protein
LAFYNPLGINGNIPNAAKPAPVQSFSVTALYTSLADNASPIGVILAASSRSNTGLSPCSFGLPSGVLPNLVLIALVKSSSGLPTSPPSA